MLSILIPTYNYNAYPLVLELQEQAVCLGINFEIIVQDDLSQSFISENQEINNLENCIFLINNQNLGRGKNINLLSSKSKYDFVLLMEADAFPENKCYLKNYIALLSETISVVFGGVKYPTKIPPKEKLLRWHYGNKREMKSLSHRLLHQYDFVFTWNLLLRKEILLLHPFPEFIKEYGYEDIIFIKNLCINSISIAHIENPLIHFNDENSSEFINKIEKAVQTLHQLIENKKIDFKDTKLTATYNFIKKLRIIGVTKAIYRQNKKRILKNLTSKSPNLFLLDFYKLGYFCSHNPSKNV